MEPANNSTSRQSKRVLLNENHICSDVVGPRGLTYGESSVMYSLLWNQPSLYPSQYSYSLRHSNPLVRKGGQADVKSSSVGLPIFYTDTEDHLLSEEEGEVRGEGEGDKEEGPTEITEESPSVVQRIPPWRRQGRRTVDYVAPSSEADIASRVRSEVGYEFPPVMSKMIEANVQRRWQKWKERGLIHADDLAGEKRLYHQLVVDTHVFLVRKVERRLLLVDSDNSESEEDEGCSTRHSQPPHEVPVQLSPGEFHSSSHSSSDEDTTLGKRKRPKRQWNRSLPHSKKATISLRNEKVRIRIKNQRKEERSSSSDESAAEGESSRDKP